MHVAKIQRMFKKTPPTLPTTITAEDVASPGGAASYKKSWRAGNTGVFISYNICYVIKTIMIKLCNWNMFSSFYFYLYKQFRIQHWKANGKKNLMIFSEIKIERLQPEKSRNMFERIQKMKKSRTIVFRFLFAISSQVFASRIIWNMALESQWKEESNDRFRNLTHILARVPVRTQ